MKLNLKRPIIFFDLETTGLDPNRDRIVELAAIKLFPDGRTEEKCRRFNPLIPIPKEATRVHGITNEDVRDQPTFARVVKHREGLVAYFSGCDLAGFNIIRFDIPLLTAELARANAMLDLTDVSVIDVYEIFAAKEPRTLEAALRFYCDRAHTDAHTALGDVRATADVLAAQLARYPDLPATPNALDGHLRDPDWVDRQGKLLWVDGEVTVGFGRNRGRTLSYLAQEEPDYLRWMIDNGVVPEAVRVLRDALIGRFPGPKSDAHQE